MAFVKPIPINAVGTVELFTIKGDGPDDVKIKISNDMGTNINPEVKEHIANIQFGMFYEFINNERKLAKTGSIFRAGMNFGARFRPDNGDDRKPPSSPKPDPEPDDGELMKPIEDLEKLIKDE